MRKDWYKVLESRKSNLTSDQKQTWVKHENACVSREPCKAEGFTGLFQEWDKHSSNLLSEACGMLPTLQSDSRKYSLQHVWHFFITEMKTEMITECKRKKEKLTWVIIYSDTSFFNTGSEWPPKCRELYYD